MTRISWVPGDSHVELIGEHHGTKPDTLNRALKDVIIRSGGDPDDVNFPGFAIAGTGGGGTGADGADGAPGTVWRTGSGAPSNGTGIDGDLYLRTSNGDVYRRASGVYSVVGNILGPAGATGPAGTLTTNEQNALTRLVGWLTAGDVSITGTATDKAALTVIRNPGATRSKSTVVIQNSGDAGTGAADNNDPMQEWRTADGNRRTWITEVGAIYSKMWLSFEPSGVRPTGDSYMIGVFCDVDGIGQVLRAPPAGLSNFRFVEYLANDGTKVHRVTREGEPTTMTPSRGVIVCASDGSLWRWAPALDGSLVKTLVYSPDTIPTTATPTPASLPSVHEGDTGTLSWQVIDQHGLDAASLASTVLEINSTNTGVITATPATLGTDAGGNTGNFTFTGVAAGTATLQLRRASDSTVIGTCAVTVSTSSSVIVDEEFPGADAASLPSPWLVSFVSLPQVIGHAAAQAAGEAYSVAYRTDAGGNFDVRVEGTWVVAPGAGVLRLLARVTTADGVGKIAADINAPNEVVNIYVVADDGSLSQHPAATAPAGTSADGDVYILEVVGSDLRVLKGASGSTVLATLTLTIDTANTAHQGFGFGLYGDTGGTGRIAPMRLLGP